LSSSTFSSVAKIETNLLSSAFSSVAKIRMELSEETLEETHALATAYEDLNQSRADLVDMLAGRCG
jgi:hypothetical protein